MSFFPKHVGICLGLVSIAVCDRPEIKQDADDVIASDQIAVGKTTSFLNMSIGGGSIIPNVGQLTTCSAFFNFNAAMDPGYNPEIIATLDRPWRDNLDKKAPLADDPTWHIFSDLNDGLDNMIKYDANCHSKLMEILVETNTDINSDITSVNDDLAKERLKKAAADKTTTAYHNKFLVRGADNIAAFIDAATTLIRHGSEEVFSGQRFDFGYLMTDGGEYFHLLQFFSAHAVSQTKERSKWTDFKNTRAQLSVSLSNKVDQKTLVLTIPDSTSIALELMEENRPATWTICHDKTHLDTTSPQITFDYPGANTTQDSNYAALKFYPMGTTKFTDSHRNCRMQSLNVVCSVRPLETAGIAVHMEYEIPAFHKLVFESSTHRLLTSSTHIAAGYLLTNGREWNGFLFYHIVLFFANTNTKSEHEAQPSEGFSAWKNGRILAVTSGVSWMKLMDQISQQSPRLHVVALQ